MCIRDSGSIDASESCISLAVTLAERGISVRTRMNKTDVNAITRNELFIFFFLRGCADNKLTPVHPMTYELFREIGPIGFNLDSKSL